MNREANASLSDLAPREDGKAAFRAGVHDEGRRPMNREANASLSDRALREDGKHAFHGNAHGEGRRSLNREANAPFFDRARARTESTRFAATPTTKAAVL